MEERFGGFVRKKYSPLGPVVLPSLRSFGIGITGFMIYLDNAATSLVRPPQVAEAVVAALTQVGNSGRGTGDASNATSLMIYQLRVSLASFFGLGARQAAHVIFTKNATEALNLAILSLLPAYLSWARPKDHICPETLSSSQLERQPQSQLTTDHQASALPHIIVADWNHNSVLRPLYRLEDQGLVKLDIWRSGGSDLVDQAWVEKKIRAQGLLDLGDLDRLYQPETHALVVSHASNLTGNALDLRTIGKWAKDHKLLFLVDAAQSAGHLPIHMEEMGIDLLALTGHKALMGPQGTGALLIHLPQILEKNPAFILDQCEPLMAGGAGILSYDRDQPPMAPERFEAGTLNGHSLAGWLAAMEYLQKEGLDKIHHQEIALLRSLYEGMAGLPGIFLYGDFREEVWGSEQRTPVLSFNLGKMPSNFVAEALAERFEIACRAGAHCAPLMHEALGTIDQGAVRFSLNAFTTRKEVEGGIAAVKTLVEEGFSSK